MIEEKNFEWSVVSQFRSEIMGVAIILVLLCHCSGFSWGMFQPYVKELAHLGACGVDIFLFVSGYGLFFSMKKNSDVLGFYKRRFLRIVPEYLFLAGISYAVLNALRKTGFEWREFLIQLSAVRAAFLYESNDARHLWYMFFIFFAYAFFPIIYFLGNCDKKAKAKFFFALTIVAYLIDALLFIAFPDFMKVYSIDTHLSRIPMFALGTYYGSQASEGKSTYKKIVPSLFAVFFALRLFKITVFGSGDAVPVGHVFVRLANQCLGIAIMLSTALLMGRLQSRGLEIAGAVLSWFGKASLELYLIHGFLMPIWSSLGFSNAWYMYFIAIIPASIMFAECILLSKQGVKNYLLSTTSV